MYGIIICAICLVLFIAWIWWEVKHAPLIDDEEDRLMDEIINKEKSNNKK